MRRLAQVGNIGPRSGGHEVVLAAEVGEGRLFGGRRRRRGPQEGGRGREKLGRPELRVLLLKKSIGAAVVQWVVQHPYHGVVQVVLGLVEKSGATHGGKVASVGLRAAEGHAASRTAASAQGHAPGGEGG